MMMRCAVLTAIMALVACGPAAAYVWWEGEAAVETNFPARSAFSPDTFPETRHLLSGDDWLSTSGSLSVEEAYARYRIAVPRSGRYELWARKFWRHGPFRWRFGEGEWQVCGPDVALADNVTLRTHLCANWAYLGPVDLSPGEHVFELRLLAKQGEDVAAAFDCFLLADEPFLPSGKAKPGERSGLADPGFFPYEPQTDSFLPEAALDLRYLNEPVAGQHGFVRREGDRFLLGDGRSVRFWGVNVSADNAAQGPTAVTYLARRLAKLGVNMVRFHSPLYDGRDDPARVNLQALDSLHRLVAALKREGIYTTLSFYFPLWFDIRPHYGIPGFEGGGNRVPFTLLYFEPRMQEIWRSWARALLITPNPYTGLPLAREPAVAVVEIVNEDSFFFWTFTREHVPAVHWARLEEMFADWLIQRYGSIERALSAWQGERLEGDNPATPRVGLYEAWHMTRDGMAAGGPGKRARVHDQVRFLAELQHGFYAAATDYLKRELGYGGLVVASNWTVTDPAVLDAAERYTYTAADVMDRHGYFGGRHEGEGASYSVRVGHTFESLAAVTAPERLPLRSVHIAGYPHTISEIGWTNPNRYRADATFLTAAYGSLQGLDGVYWFAVGANSLCDGELAKFPVGGPVVAGSFPAAALLYRRGDVQEAPVAAHETLSLDDLFAMAGSALTAEAALDQLRQQDLPRGASGREAACALDPLAWYVGRVERSFGDPAETSRPIALDDFIRRDAKTIKSLTGELEWSYGLGLATITTPRAQGAAGFLGKVGRVDLGDVALECENEFASVLIVSLDDQPLAQSQRILIQTITEEQPYGFRVEDGRIESLGEPPLGMRRVAATVWLPPGEARVAALDESGYAMDRAVEVVRDGPDGRLAIRLAEDALYHVVERASPLR